MRFHIPARFLLAALLMLAFTSTRTLAQIPRTLSCQALLTDNAGTPKPDGQYSVTFRLYDVASGGVSLWTEDQVVQVKNGLFSAVLGSVTPFGDGLAFTQPYWLSLEVAPDPELPSRLPLTASGYSLGPWTSTTAVNNNDAVESGQETNIYYNNGNVGIGTATPNDKLDVVGRLRASSPSSNQITVQTSGPTNSWAQFRMSTTNQSWLMGTSQGFNGDQFYLSDLTSNISRMMIQPNGGEILFPNPFSNHIVVRTSGPTNSWAQIRMSTTNRTWILGTSQEFNGDQFYLSDLTSNQARMMIQPNGGAITFPLGNIGIGTTTPTAKLEVIGRTKTGSLEITAGSDLAEPFDTGTDDAMEPGSIMIIDPANPGKLRMSEQPYDTRVAGIVSGAGGVNPGITLQQNEVLEGKSLVAIAGRVYCKADVHGGPIAPGDMLTTSNIPGHAMKATERDRSHGAIIGKAMTGLAEGTGLVLVLVNLQ